MKTWCAGTAAILLLALLRAGDAYLFKNNNYDSVEREEALAKAAAAAKEQAKTCTSVSAPAPRPRATFKATKVGTIMVPATGA